MNFRPTKKKLVVSLIVLVGMTLLGSWFLSTFDCFNNLGYIPNAPAFTCPILGVQQIIACFIVFGIPSFVLVYVIWSLLEKKQDTAKYPAKA